MSDEPEEQVSLCDPCSKKLTVTNWLGTLVMDESFTCILCKYLCCRHLKIDGEPICVSCANHDV